MTAAADKLFRLTVISWLKMVRNIAKVCQMRHLQPDCRLSVYFSISMRYVHSGAINTGLRYRAPVMIKTGFATWRLWIKRYVPKIKENDTI